MLFTVSKEEEKSVCLVEKEPSILGGAQQREEVIGSGLARTLDSSAELSNSWQGWDSPLMCCGPLVGLEGAGLAPGGEQDR